MCSFGGVILHHAGIGIPPPLLYPSWGVQKYSYVSQRWNYDFQISSKIHGEPKRFNKTLQLHINWKKTDLKYSLCKNSDNYFAPLKDGWLGFTLMTELCGALSSILTACTLRSTSTDNSPPLLNRLKVWNKKHAFQNHVINLRMLSMRDWKLERDGGLFT